MKHHRVKIRTQDGNIYNGVEIHEEAPHYSLAPDFESSDNIKLKTINRDETQSTVYFNPKHVVYVDVVEWETEDGLLDAEGEEQTPNEPDETFRDNRRGRRRR